MNIVRRYKNAVINLDDPHSADALEAAKGAKKCLTYSVRADAGADIYATDIERVGHKTRFTAVTPGWSQTMEIIIPGVFNVGNALAASRASALWGSSRLMTAFL